EQQRWPHDLERGFRLARDIGLKVHLSLGRFGNLFAGPSYIPSWYTFRHLQSRVMDRHGRYHEISCFNHQSFRSWLFKEIEYFLNEDVTMVGKRGADLVEITRKYDKRSQLWLQNFNLDEHSEPQLASAFMQLLSAEPDELGCYYYWRNNVNPDRVWETTRRLL